VSLYPTAVDSRTLVAQIADTLRAGVILGHLQPGERIRQDDFTTQLGVSRTPLREAFRVLENESGLISRPRIGVEVTGLTAVEVEKIALVRLPSERSRRVSPRSPTRQVMRGSSTGCCMRPASR